MDIAPPPVDSVPEAALTQCLRELPNSVVLRNEADLFGNLRRGGDVDLLVIDPELAEGILIRHLGAPIRIERRSYATGYSYDWGHIDLLPTIEWRGASFLRTEDVLANRQRSAHGRWVPTIAHEAAISWLTNLLFGGSFKARYAPEIRQAVAEDGIAFRRTLTEALGQKWGRQLWEAASAGRPEISAAWTPALRRAVWWRACATAPVRTVRRYLAYVRAELRLRLAPPVPWIAVLGSDGSGKSSVVHELVRRFATCPYANAIAFHWRPRLVARSHGAELVTAPHARPNRGALASTLRLGILGADWIVGYWGRLVHLRTKGHILAFDRMYFDLVVDPKRYRYGGGPRMARALWWWLPKPDLLFFLDAPPDVLWRRKQEVEPSELARQRNAYLALVRQHPGGHVLDGTRPIDLVAGDIQRVVRAWMRARSIASLAAVHGRVGTAHGDDSSGAPILAGRGDGAS